MTLVCPEELLDKASRAPLNDRNFWDWYYEPGTPATDIGELAHDLVFEVPRQDQHVIGLGFINPLWRKNRNMGAWQISAMFVWVAINGIVQKIGADTAIVEQRIALTWRPVAGKGFVAALRLDQEAQQFALSRANLFGKSGISLKPVQAGQAFAGKQLGDGRLRRVAVVIGMTRVDTQRAAVCRQLIDVEHA